LETTSQLSKIRVSLTELITQFGESFATKKPLSVPCGECRACCIGLSVQLHDFELKKGYEKKYSKKLQCWTLKQKKDKSCIYLNEIGCSIHDRVPQTCHQFTCQHTALFNIRDPQRPDIDAARQRWIFDIDNQRLADFMRDSFKLGIKVIDKNNPDQLFLLIRQTLINGCEWLKYEILNEQKPE